MEGENKNGRLRAFFRRIGESVRKAGEITSSTPVRIRDLVKKEPTIKREGGSLSERLHELQELEEEDQKIEEMLEKEMELEEREEKEWEKRSRDLERPLSERFADFFFQPFKKPSSKLSGFFSELEEDLDKAYIKIPAEHYIGMLLGIGSIAGIVVLILTGVMIGSILIAFLAGIISFIMPLGIGRFYPKQKIGKRSNEINQEIPYALRHLATQLSSGIGLPEAMTSVSRSRYGALSEEFARAITDMRRGESMADALNRMRDRVKSDFLTRAIRQIQRTLRTGGNISRTLNILADEAAFTMRMNLRNYTQSLNMMSMIYMFAAAVMPPMLIVVMIITGFIGGGLFPPALLNMVFLVFIPVMLIYLIIIFKRMEPSV